MHEASQGQAMCPASPVWLYMYTMHIPFLNVLVVAIISFPDYVRKQDRVGQHVHMGMITLALEKYITKLPVSKQSKPDYIVRQSEC